MSFMLTICTTDVNTITKNPEHYADIAGTVVCRALSVDPMLVIEGSRFQLFVPTPDRADECQMLYHLNLLTTNGERYLFEGFKRVRNGTVWYAWEETTMLFVTVKKVIGEDNNLQSSEVVGRGLLRIRDFWRQLASIVVRWFSYLLCEVSNYDLASILKTRIPNLRYFLPYEAG